MITNAIDTERFRLRNFVARLAELGELQVEEAPAAFETLTETLEASRKAVLFRSAGPEGFELVGGVMGSRERLGIALECGPREIGQALRQRLANPQPVVTVTRAEAPVQQVVWTGADADLRRLPFYLQHDEDGGVYISAALDYSVDPVSKRPNVGSRRLFLRGHDTLSTNLSQPSDLKRIYLGAVERGETLKVSFAIGTHPLDFIAAGLRDQVDEFALQATVRGAPMAMVPGVTNQVLVPADAELVIEGYFDTLGHRLPEGPYAEFWGLNGEMHVNPLFHVTAITMRADVLHQTVLHGSRIVSEMEAAALSAVACEMVMLNVLGRAGIVPSAVFASSHVAAMQHVRVALPRGVPGQARQVITLLHKLPGFRYVQVVDDEVDVFSDEEAEWAISTRFRADRDLVVVGNVPGIHADPTRDADGLTAKMGLDCTAPYDVPDVIETRRPRQPAVHRGAAVPIEVALADGALSFAQLLGHVGEMDGRDLAMRLEEGLQAGKLARVTDGKWALTSA